jgi:hypothetical protein
MAELQIMLLFWWGQWCVIVLRPVMITASDVLKADGL